ncbi:hypothetical protein LWI29_023705 [Acer saccharum]|uniref:Uncharacterized protein n=1 Tax=Acer saccharum TaxID=4024 RepID=A0AA39VCF0_ACESA|nr:hypothetical protein LWI29_023705 [Acer saccharum]
MGDFHALAALTNISPMVGHVDTNSRSEIGRFNCNFAGVEDVIVAGRMGSDKAPALTPTLGELRGESIGNCPRHYEWYVRIVLKEGDLEDEMKTNLQQTQTTYERLLNGFMKASQDRFSKLENSVKRIEGHIGRIAKKVLNGEIGSSNDSLHLGGVKAILRSGRIVNNGRNEEQIEESNKTPR